MENIIDPTVVSDFDYVMPEKLLYIRAEWTQSIDVTQRSIYEGRPLQTVLMYKL